MINETRVTVVGNVGQDPELRFTPAGAAVATFSVAVTPRRLDRNTNKWVDGEATWYRVNAWRALGENIAETIRKGHRVIVVGNLAARNWKNDKGETGVSWEITAEAVGPDLTWSTATVTRAKRDGVPMPADPWESNGNGGQPSAPVPAAAGSNGWGSGSPGDAWGTGNGAPYSDEPPF